MSKRITRRQVRAWLRPIRDCFAQIKTGYVDSSRGYAITRLHESDDYARIDWCIAGMRALIYRLCPEIDCSSLERIEKRLAAGVLLTVQEIDEALRLLNRCENELMRHSIFAVKNAVLTEQIAIELESLGIKEAA